MFTIERKLNQGTGLYDDYFEAPIGCKNILITAIHTPKRKKSPEKGSSKIIEYYDIFQHKKRSMIRINDEMKHKDRKLNEERVYKAFSKALSKLLFHYNMSV